MTSADTRLNALIRVMTEEQKTKLIEAAKDILMAANTHKTVNTGGMIYDANPNHP